MQGYEVIVLGVVAMPVLYVLGRFLLAWRAAGAARPTYNQPTSYANANAGSAARESSSQAASSSTALIKIVGALAIGGAIFALMNRPAAAPVEQPVSAPVQQPIAAPPVEVPLTAPVVQPLVVPADQGYGPIDLPDVDSAPSASVIFPPILFSAIAVVIVVGTLVITRTRPPRAIVPPVIRVEDEADIPLASEVPLTDPRWHYYAPAAREADRGVRDIPH